MSLRNTGHIYGLIVFAGPETKVMKNAEEAKYKPSRLEVATNKTIKLVLLVQLIFSIIGGVMGYYYRSSEYNSIIEESCLKDA